MRRPLARRAVAARLNAITRGRYAAIVGGSGQLAHISRTRLRQRHCKFTLLCTDLKSRGPRLIGGFGSHTLCGGWLNRVGTLYRTDTNEVWIVSVRCQGVGPRLLGAIENLANLIQRNEENFRAIPQLSRDLSRDSSDYPDSPTFQGGRQDGLLSGQDGGAADGAKKSIHPSLSDTAGLDSVLEWPIFPKPVPFAIDPFSHASPRGEAFSPRSPPAMEFYELSRLVDLYLTNVHPMNPVVDSQMLRQMLKQVAENGPDWSASTCIVALSCALGAISQRPGQRTPSGTPRGYSVEPNRHLASRYWSVAEKRLGFSMGSPGWESVQCLCLAG